jgi:hypothetical protein
MNEIMNVERNHGFMSHQQIKFKTVGSIPTGIKNKTLGSSPIGTKNEDHGFKSHWYQV